MKRVGCWEQRDTRGKRGYDGEGKRGHDGEGAGVTEVWEGEEV